MGRKTVVLTAKMVEKIEDLAKAWGKPEAEVMRILLGMGAYFGEAIRGDMIIYQLPKGEEFELTDGSGVPERVVFPELL